MTERFRALLPFVPYLAVSLAHVIACFGQYAFEGWTKLLLMPALAAGVVASAVLVPELRLRPVPVGALALLLAAITFSWLGDGAATFFPMFESEIPMMLACFGVAHIAYIVLLWRTRGIAKRRLPAWSLVYVLAYLVLLALLLPHTKSLSIPVMAYGLVLVATAALATRCGAVIAWGGAFFLLSDAILAFRLFVPGSTTWTSGVVMLTYTLGQGLLAYGIVAALRRRADRGEAGPTTPRAGSSAAS
ncbi:lysoplasmalogenase family protein [Leucobacter sp. USHLN154]|uniref:lysoplasmalogenase family protein n=1 Tax=Leucobacter sp. USHLN154 TaxID=3081269 RepID=UPI003018563A